MAAKSREARVHLPRLVSLELGRAALAGQNVHPQRAKSFHLHRGFPSSQYGENRSRTDGLCKAETFMTEDLQPQGTLRKLLAGRRNVLLPP